MVSLTDEMGERDAMHKLSTAVDRLKEFAVTESTEIEEAATALNHYSHTSTSGCQTLEKLARDRRKAAKSDAEAKLCALAIRVDKTHTANQSLQPEVSTCEQLSGEAAVAWKGAVSAVGMLRRLRGQVDGADAVVGRLAETVQRASQAVLMVYECSERATELVRVHCCC